MKEINDIRFKLKNKQKEIAFYEDTHEYFYKGKKLPSVSSYVEKYSNPFDPDGSILKRIASRNGITPEEQKEKWNKISKDACDYGTKVHEKHELMLQEVIEPNDLIKDLWQMGYKLIDTEIILFNDNWAGQCDILMFDVVSKEVVLLDFKTNKKPINEQNPYNKFMLPPYDFLPDTPYGHYTIQLNMYRSMLENWGVEVKKMNLIQISENDYNFININKVNLLE